MLGTILISVLSSLALLGNGVSAYANPGACSGDCWAHDPAVVRRESDGLYFRFNTGSKIGILKSNSLSGPWVYQGAAIPAGSKINIAGKDDLWVCRGDLGYSRSVWHLNSNTNSCLHQAPEVQKVGSLYIMYYSVSTFGSQTSAIGYATSPSMEFGTWTDHGATGVSSTAGKPYNAIDANLIQAGSNYYMNFGSFWGDIYQVPMSADAKTATGSSYQIAYQPSGSHAVEGSFMWSRNNMYYLFWSEGICCGYDKTKPAAGAEYKIRVCRSANVNGPFVDKNGVDCRNGGGTTVLESHGFVYGPGGQGIFADPTYGTVLYYHYGMLLLNFYKLLCLSLRSDGQTCC
jgi:arabinan endo-1,5-alpha-L-arabinosidase